MSKGHSPRPIRTCVRCWPSCVWAKRPHGVPLSREIASHRSRRGPRFRNRVSRRRRRSLLVQGKIKSRKARVAARDRDRTKTNEDRLVELCPRALHVLKRQLALKARLKLAGKIRHDEVFFKDDGSRSAIFSIAGSVGARRSRARRADDARNLRRVARWHDGVRSARDQVGDGGAVHGIDSVLEAASAKALARPSWH